MGLMTTQDQTLRTAILSVDDDPGVSRAVARDLRRRYGERYLSTPLFEFTDLVNQPATAPQPSPAP